MFAVRQLPEIGEVDPGLGVGGGGGPSSRRSIRVVGDESVARHLGEESEEGRDEETTAKSGGAEHLQPALLGVFHLKFDGRTNLGHLGLHEEGVRIALGMILDEDRVGLILLRVFADQVARALGRKLWFCQHRHERDSWALW